MAQKRKFEVLEELKDKCFLCNKNFWHMEYRAYKHCNHCHRIFCDKCFDQELETKDPKIEKIYENSNPVLSQCSLCITCNNEEQRKAYSNVIKPFHKSLACIKCTPIQQRYNIAITEIIEKKYITELLKKKIEQDYKKQMEKIETDLKILQDCILELDQNTIKTITNNKIKADQKIRNFYIKYGPCSQYSTIEAYTPR